MNNKRIGLQLMVGLSALVSLIAPFIGDWAQAKMDDEDFEKRVNEIIDKREEAQK